MTVTLRERAQIVAFEEGKRVFERLSGDDLCQDTGRYNHKVRLIDYQNDWYRETVTDPETGRVIHHCEERLSEHRDHGSAKVRIRR
jgi:hypothetical protein